MAADNRNKHLIFEERKIIETGAEHGCTQKSIADTIGKQKSTVGKEIKLHREQTYKCALPVECAIYRTCRPGGTCIGASCSKYVPFKCNRRDHSPGVCNGCKKTQSCRFNKFRYNAVKAQAQYEETLKDSRTGVNLTSQEAKEIAVTIAPLLAQGQSPYTILANHPELKISERTLYSYIEGGILHYAGPGVTVMDLRRQVSRKQQSKTEPLLKKREDRSYLKGRSYQDYKSFREQNPHLPVVQMDTVYNVEKDPDDDKYKQIPPFMQTFKFVEYGFLFALYHTVFSAEEMKNGVDLLEKLLSADIFRKHVPSILTDRGTEFVNQVEAMERKDGNLRTRVFFCDPQSSCQKGSLENNHIELRYILPKSVNLFELGLKSQSDLNLVLSHINSTPKEHLHGKSPMQVMSFMEPELYRKFLDFGLKEIERDKVILKPYLLK